MILRFALILQVMKGLADVIQTTRKSQSNAEKWKQKSSGIVDSLNQTYKGLKFLIKHFYPNFALSIFTWNYSESATPIAMQYSMENSSHHY